MAPTGPNANQKDAKKGDAKKRERKDYAPLSLGTLSDGIKDVPKEEMVKVIPGRDRSKEQQMVDQAVRDVVMANIESGNTKDFRSAKVKSITLPPAQAETFRFMVGKAGTFLNAKVRFGRPASQGGNEIVAFTAWARDVNQWVDGTSPAMADDDDEPDDDEPNGDDGKGEKDAGKPAAPAGKPAAPAAPTGKPAAPAAPTGKPGNPVVGR